MAYNIYSVPCLSQFSVVRHDNDSRSFIEIRVWAVYPVYSDRIVSFQSAVTTYCNTVIDMSVKGFY